MSDERYEIRIAFEADHEPRRMAEAFLDALDHEVAPAAPATSVSADEERVVVRFHEVDHDVPPAAEEYEPARTDDPREAAAREAIAELGDRFQGTPVIPVIRALVAASAARARAGLSPRHRIVIEVEPSPMHGQDELRHS